jgi:hypothetical protein
MPELRKNQVVNRGSLFPVITVNARRVLPLLKKTSHKSCFFCEENKELTPPEVMVHRKNTPDSPG